MKLTKKLYSGTTLTGSKNYINGIEYNGANLEAIYHADGRLLPNGAAWHYDYTIRDHLGNARVTFRANGSTWANVEEVHYYPFGMQMENAGTANPANKYLYNGKERNEDFGLNLMDYGARWYDAAVGRWWSVDPLAEKYVRWSGYCYGINNPVRFLDPDGMSVSTDYYDISGKKIGTDGVNNGEKRLVLTSATSKEVKKEMKEKGKFTNEASHADIIQVQSAQEVAALENVYAKTETGEAHEEGFVAGKDASGNVKITDYPPGPSITGRSKVNLDEKAVLETESAHTSGGASIDYIAHSHPWYSKDDGSRGGFPGPSGEVGNTGDLNHQKDLETKYGTKYGIILGYTPDGGKRMINFYTSKGSINTVSYDKYKKAISKIK